MRIAPGIFLLNLLTVTACVSVSIAPKSAKRATGVTYSEPTNPFTKESRTDVDGAWKNARNGNMISYLTECQDENDPSLESIVQGALGGLSDLKVEKRETPTIQGREGRRVLAYGNVDGVATEIDLLSFKRDSCIYILSYVGVKAAFAQDHARFDQFVGGFRAP